VWCPNYEFFQYIRTCQWLVPFVNCGSAVRFVLGTSVTVTLLLRDTTRMRSQHLRRVRNWFSTVEKNTSKPKEKDIRNHLWPWKQMLAKVIRKRMYTRVILQQMPQQNGLFSRMRATYFWAQMCTRYGPGANPQCAQPASWMHATSLIRYLEGHTTRTPTGNQKYGSDPSILRRV